MGAMTGDGISHTSVSAPAQVGIAMGTDTDVVVESAGVTLVKGNLCPVFFGQGNSPNGFS